MVKEIPPVVGTVASLFRILNSLAERCGFESPSE